MALVASETDAPKNGNSRVLEWLMMGAVAIVMVVGVFNMWSIMSTTHRHIDGHFVVVQCQQQLMAAETSRFPVDGGGVSATCLSLLPFMPKQFDPYNTEATENVVSDLDRRGLLAPAVEAMSSSFPSVSSDTSFPVIY